MFTWIEDIMTKKIIPTALIATFSLSSHAVTTMDTVVVTANRTAVPISDVLAPISIITADDIERLQLSNMSDILTRMTGVQSYGSGGPGSTTSLFIRGGNTEHSLVLLDGIRISSASNGGSALQLIDTSSIDRIELVRGPRTSLYGADAVSAVLNITTKKAVNNSASINTSIGGYGEQKSSLRLETIQNNTQASVQISHETLGGFDRSENDSFSNKDKDEFRNSHLQANLNQRWSDSGNSQFSYQTSHGKSDFDQVCNEYDAFFNPTEVACSPYSETIQEVLSNKNSFIINNKFNIAAHFSRNIDDSEVLGSTTNASFKTTRHSYSLTADAQVASTLKTVSGIESYSEELNSSNNYQESKRQNNAAFSQWMLDTDAIDIQLGVRYDDNESYGSNVTRSVVVGRNLSNNWLAIASWGEAFRAPTFNDLYWPTSGNPDLDPESSESYDITLKFHNENSHFYATAFHNSVDNLIAWAPVIPGDFSGSWQPSNINNAKMEGVELEFAYISDSLSLQTNYTWMEPKDTNTGKQLQSRSKQLMNINADYTLSALSFGLTVSAQDKSFANSSNSIELAGFAILDLRSTYRNSKNLKFDFAITNVLDKKYQRRNGFNEAGIAAKAGASYTF